MKQKLEFVIKDKIFVSIASIIFLLVTGYIIFNYLTPEWKMYQQDFISVVEEKLGVDRAATVRDGLHQIYVKELGVTDRCITCHMGMEWKGMETAENPFRTHPKEILEKHPISTFGCTPCHGGQGYATDMQAAHGFAEHWEEPLLGNWSSTSLHAYVRLEPSKLP